MRNRLILPVRNYSAEAKSSAITWKTINDNAIGIGVAFYGFSAVAGAFVYFVGNQLQHVEERIGIKLDDIDKKIDIKIDHVVKKIDHVEKEIDIKIDNVEKKIDNLEKGMADNHKELMAAINPLVVKVLVLEERFSDIRNK
jgi:uncharacterized membrane protein YhiD involved in acid resistance